MPDPRREEIRAALERPISGELFERCACRLLANFHPSLVPVSGGNDAGLDGIGTDAGGQFGLIATVGAEPLRNLRRNLHSYREAGGAMRRFIFATPRVLSGRRQVRLATEAESLGFELLRIYDGAAFAEFLYRDSESCSDLLGIAPGLQTLSSFPLTRRLSVRVPLQEREETLAALAAANGDLLIVGKPGIGKTAVLQHLVDTGWGLFDVGASINAVVDGIRKLSPPRVLVDDAHFDPDRLVELRRARQETGLPFHIVATSWPGSLNSVMSVLPEAKVFEIQELTREGVLELIKTLGLRGPRELQASIVGQALGRAGLATTLTMATLNGRVERVVTGSLLFEDTVEWYRRVLGDQSAQLLATFALSGAHGATVEQCATAMDVSALSVSALIQQMASGGVLDEVFQRGSGTRYVRVQPEALRYAMVKGFFGGKGAPDWHPVAAHFDTMACALIPLIGARFRGAAFSSSELQPLLTQGAGVEELRAFASLGPAEARQAIVEFPAFALEIARVSLSVDLELGVKTLMTLAVGDRREQHGAPDHPIRIIAEYLARPEGSAAERSVAITQAERWLREGRDAAVALEILCAALYPGIKDAYVDPGAGRTFTLVEHALPPDELANVDALWDPVLEILADFSFDNYEALLSALRNWVYPNSIQLGRSVDASTQSLLRACATRVIRRLAEILGTRPGVVSALRDLSANAQLAIPDLVVPSDFDSLYPRADYDDDLRALEARLAARVEALAAELAAASPVEIGERISSVEREAQAVGRTWPRLTPQLCALIASRSGAALAIMRELDAREAAGDLLLPFLDRLVRERPAGWEDQIRSFLSQQRTEWAAIQVCLTGEVVSALRSEAVSHIEARHGNLIDFLIARGQLKDETLLQLLTHPNREVSQNTATALRGEQAESLSQPTAQARRVALVNATDGSRDEYWLWRILESDPALLRDWVIGWIRRNSTEYADPLSPEALTATGKLPPEVRSEILTGIPPDMHNFYLGDLIAALVGDDDDLAASLLGRADLTDYRLRPLAQPPSPAWMRKALIAFRAGASPSEIVRACMLGLQSWSGPESDHWDEYVRGFAALRTGSASQVAIANEAVTYFSILRDRAKVRERHEAVFGDDRA